MQSQFNSPFVGLDVSKPFLDVCVVGPHEPRSWRVVQEPAAHAALVAELVELQPQLIVIEATGRYELPIVEAMLAAGLPVVVINPKRVRDYLAKRNIAVFGIDVDSFDWRVRTPEKVMHNVFTTLDKTGGGIILFHDIHANTAKTIPAVLAELKKRSYKVVHLVPKSRLEAVAAVEPTQASPRRRAHRHRRAR